MVYYEKAVKLSQRSLARKGWRRRATKREQAVWRWADFDLLVAIFIPFDRQAPWDPQNKSFRGPRDRAPAQVNQSERFT